jgi:hypothetical protein
MVNTVWFILMGLWSAAGYGFNKERMLAKGRTNEADGPEPNLTQAQNGDRETLKREEALQKTMVERGISREELEAKLRKYGL